jgi:hypothetical protein
MKNYYLALGFAALIIYVISALYTKTITQTEILILSLINFVWVGFLEKHESGNK